LICSNRERSRFASSTTRWSRSRTRSSAASTAASVAAPFSSGSNRYDALVVIPCSVSTMAKIAAGIADTLITRAAQVAMKERMRMVLCVRETPLSTLALRNALELSREGVVIMPIAPPWYRQPQSLDQLVAGFTDKVLGLLGEESGGGWREGELE